MISRLMLSSVVVVGAYAACVSADPGNNTPPAAAVPAAKAPKATRGEPAKSEGDKAAEPTLKVGDKAPAIAVDNWVKGGEVKSFEPGKVYVVEFWATWCPPCRESIPHLTKMAKDHKDLTVIGVTSSERKEKDGADKRMEKLQKFVTDQGDKMNYHVAYDGDREMGASWLKAAGKSTIPTAFVVDHTGKIAWIGNPLDDGFDAAVEKELKAAGATKKADAGQQQQPKKS